MDERLKKKLELLGEPTLPESLSAEELFRRMDSGELTLPEEDPVSRSEAVIVIPWAKLLSRGLPIAACLAVVVAMAQTGLWRIGTSGGANLAAQYGTSAAADQTVPAGDGEVPSDGSGTPTESNGRETAETPPEPEPWAIAAASDAEESIDEDAGDLSRQRTNSEEAAANGRVDTEAAGTMGDAMEDREPSGRPDSGGRDDDWSDAYPDSGTDEGNGPSFNPDCSAGTGDGDDLHPDTGGGDDDWQSNPDTGGGYDENDPIYIQLKEIADQLCPEVEKLTGVTGLIPNCRWFDCNFNSDGIISEVTGYFGYWNDEDGTVFNCFLRCLVTWEDGGKTARLELAEWGEWKPSQKGEEASGDSDPDPGFGEPNPDTSGGGDSDAGEDPDTAGGNGSDTDETPDVGEKDDPDYGETPDSKTEDEDEDEKESEEDDAEDPEEEAEESEDSESDLREEKTDDPEEAAKDDLTEATKEELTDELSLPCPPMEEPDGE